MNFCAKPRTAEIYHVHSPGPGYRQRYLSPHGPNFQTRKLTGIRRQVCSPGLTCFVTISAD